MPLLLAFMLTGALRFAFGATRGARLAAAGAAAAFLCAAWLIAGVNSWPPQTGVQKLPFIVAGGLLLGLVIDVATARRSTVFAAALWLLASYAWIAWPRFARADSALAGILLAGYVLSVVALFRLTAETRPSVNVPVMLLVGALGLAGGALAAGSLALFQLALAAAAAIGGFALWNWPTARFPFDAAGVLGAGVGVLALAALILLLTEIRPWALLALAFVFLADPIARRLPVGRLRRQSIEPIYVALLALVPAVVSVLLAAPPQPGDDLYYR